MLESICKYVRIIDLHKIYFTVMFVAFELSVKPTLSDTYTIKRVYLSVDGSDVRKDRTENVLDLQSNQVLLLIFQ